MTSKTAELFDAIRIGELARVKSLLDSDPTLSSAKNESGVSAILTSLSSCRSEIRALVRRRETRPTRRSRSRPPTR
jgi:hypothetical protein